jgi:hypothetical protein
VAPPSPPSPAAAKQEEEEDGAGEKQPSRWSLVADDVLEVAVEVGDILFAIIFLML